MNAYILDNDLKQTAEKWCELLNDVNEEDLRMVDTVIKTAALMRAGDAAKKDKSA